METIQVTGTLPKIAPGDLAAFKRIAKQAMDIVKSESTTLQYDWFFNADETQCVVRETYANSDAALSHLGNLAELLGPLVQLSGGVELQIFGNPSPQLREALASMQPTVFGFFQGK